jgi:signal transduction histidine kinase
MLLNGDAGPLNNKQKEYLGKIYQGDRRMAELINVLLNVSRIEAGVLQIKPRMVDLKKLCFSVVAEYQAVIKNKKLKILQSCPGLDSKYRCDPVLMRLVLQNLISNAVKYTPAKGEITLHIKKTGREVLLSVKDTGCGIPLDNQVSIFNKFYRADNAKLIDMEGNGLGLYIIKSVIETAGGKIWFESVAGQGTTFFVQLPAKGMVARAGVKSLV